MALSFHQTTAPVFGRSLPAPDAADMTSFLHDDVHSEVSDALLGFVYDPLDPSSHAAIDELLNIPGADAGFTGPVVGAAAASLGPIRDDAKVVEQHCDKKLRAACTDDDARYGLGSVVRPSQQWYGGGGGGNQQVPALTDFLLPLPQPLAAFVHGSDEKKPGPGGTGCHPSAQSAAARERRRRISQKTAELSRLIPGGNRMSTADMLEEAGRHVKLLQAQVGMLALTHSVGSSEKENKTPITAALEEMRPLLVSGSVQERLAAEGRCLVPRKLVDAVARDGAVKSNPRVNRDLGRFVASLEQ